MEQSVGGRRREGERGKEREKRRASEDEVGEDVL